MDAAHQGHSLQELIDQERQAGKWSDELAAEHEFASDERDEQDSARCHCGAEIFPADDECTACLHGSVSQEAAERAIDAAESRLEDR